MKPRLARDLGLGNYLGTLEASPIFNRIGIDDKVPGDKL